MVIPTITVIGSLNYDLVTYSPFIPKSGETMTATRFETHNGGKGHNQALASQRTLPMTDASLDAPKIRMVGRIGDDLFGKQLKGGLEKEGVDVQHVKVITEKDSNGDSVSTGVATILVEEKTGDNRILITLGANGYLVNLNYEDIFPSPTSNDYVILQNEQTDIEASLTWLETNRPNYKLIYNPSPFIGLPDELWQGVDYLLLNETEAKQLVEHLFKVSLDDDDVPILPRVKGYISKLITKLSKRTTIIITIGPDGCYYHSNNSEDYHKGYNIPKEKVIDTTGAGDTFLGALVSSLSCNWNLDKCIDYAIKASALAVTKRGAADGIPYYREVFKIL